MKILSIFSVSVIIQAHHCEEKSLTFKMKSEILSVFVVFFVIFCVTESERNKFKN